LVSATALWALLRHACADPWLGGNPRGRSRDAIVGAINWDDFLPALSFTSLTQLTDAYPPQLLGDPAPRGKDPPWPRPSSSATPSSSCFPLEASVKTAAFSRRRRLGRARERAPHVHQRADLTHRTPQREKRAFSGALPDSACWWPTVRLTGRRASKMRRLFRRAFGDETEPGSGGAAW